MLGRGLIVVIELLGEIDRLLSVRLGEFLGPVLQMCRLRLGCIVYYEFHVGFEMEKCRLGWR